MKYFIRPFGDFTHAYRVIEETSEAYLILYRGFGYNKHPFYSMLARGLDTTHTFKRPNDIIYMEGNTTFIIRHR